MIEISLPWTPIQALSHLAAEGDIRRQLQGVWVDSSGPTRVIVASDGSVLGVYRTDEPSDNTPPVFLPLHILKACKGFSATATVRIDDMAHASIECLGTRHYWQDERQAMVDWRRVFPRTAPSGTAQHFDLALLARFVKAHKAFGRAKWKPPEVQISHDGGRPGFCPALVLMPAVPEFAGVVMPAPLDQDGAPMRSSTPDWIRASRGEAVEAVECDLA